MGFELIFINRSYPMVNIEIYFIMKIYTFYRRYFIGYLGGNNNHDNAKDVNTSWFRF